jgi:DNA-binding LacI/PurR family transcriptional regulator
MRIRFAANDCVGCKVAQRTRIAGASIQDVARIANVSTSTVSRVLSGAAGAVAISEATANRVRSVAKELHYRPNPSARNLRTNTTRTVGVIVRDLLQPFSAEFLRAIYAACDDRGYQVLIANAENNLDAGWALGNILHPDLIDGILLVGDVVPASIGPVEMAAFIEDHGHVTTVGCRPVMAGEVCICVNNAVGVTLAMQHLFDRGHRDIAFIGAREEPGPWEDMLRWKAYRRFMDEHNLPWEQQYMGTLWDSKLSSAQEVVRGMITAPVRPTAAFATYDLAALVMLKAAQSCGLRVPDDLSLVAFDDIPYAALSTPGLTTVRQPIDDMGRYAANVLLDRIMGAAHTVPLPTDSSPVIFQPTLIERETVRDLTI